MKLTILMYISVNYRLSFFTFILGLQSNNSQTTVNQRNKVFHLHSKRTHPGKHAISIFIYLSILWYTSMLLDFFCLQIYIYTNSILIITQWTCYICICLFPVYYFWFINRAFLQKKMAWKVMDYIILWFLDTSI